MASYNGYAGNGGLRKITKTRAANVKVVKPILKKLAYSEKNSLDLDRGWEEQTVGQLDGSFAEEWNGSYGPRSYSAKDVSFAFPVTREVYGTAGDIGGHAAAGTGALVNGGAGGGGAVTGGSSSNVRAKFQHGRSASQASTGSGPRGAFMHPFQQTPRTATPPLSRSYANSLASFDNGPRDYSPTITETEDDVLSHSNLQTQHLIHNSNLSHHTQPTFPPPNARRPSLASQRTDSYTDINTSVPIPRSNTTGRISAAGTVSSSRLAHDILAESNSDLHLNLLQGGHSPTGSLGGGFPSSVASPTSSAPVTTMSPLRSSFDAASFPRLRSKSELDSAARAESIRAARRKFEERERAKEEKYDREMIKKRERRDNKEASRIEKEAATRKASMSGSEATRSGLSRKSTTTDNLTISTGYSGGSGKSTVASSRRDVSSASFWAPPRSSISGLRRNTEEMPSSAEKVGFAARKYESVPATQAPPAFVPGVDDVRFEPARPRRTNTAKRKTQGYWQGFILWFRTKLLRISGR
ncbi:hypothetical protein V8F33_000206 [Rhypophila sp. PSN 637]